jgi:hypothetical protein
VGQGGEPLGDRSEAIKAQCIHGQTAQRRQNLNAVGLAIAVRIFLDPGIAGPVPAGTRSGGETVFMGKADMRILITSALGNLVYKK